MGNPHCTFFVEDADAVDLAARGAEIEHLADTFNRMTERIRSLISGMREMTDNIAHDLKSPLARLQAGLEDALRSGGEEAGIAADGRRVFFCARPRDMRGGDCILRVLAARR